MPIYENPLLAGSFRVFGLNLPVDKGVLFLRRLSKRCPGVGD
jgi:hypothetical protein